MKNRPNKTMYLYKDKDYNLNVHNDYVNALEEYCDWLEKTNSQMDDQIRKNQESELMMRVIDLECLSNNVNMFAHEILDFEEEDIPVEVVCRKLYKHKLIYRFEDEWVSKDEL